jgi:hypothetical protein
MSEIKHVNKLCGVKHITIALSLLLVSCTSHSNPQSMSGEYEQPKPVRQGERQRQREEGDRRPRAALSEPRRGELQDRAPKGLRNINGDDFLASQLTKREALLMMLTREEIENYRVGNFNTSDRQREREEAITKRRSGNKTREHNN